MKRFLILGLLAIALFDASVVRSQEPVSGTQPGKVSITRDPQNGAVTVSWSGKGTLKRLSGNTGTFQTVTLSQKAQKHQEKTLEQVALYRVENEEPAKGVYSQNVVGYVNFYLPPGLSFIHNPLRNSDNKLATVWPTAEDGAQVMRFVQGAPYEVSTFDGVTGTWSNPNLLLPVGQGFYFRNPSSNMMVLTCVGEVLQGQLVNPLPAGLSMKGSLVPQAGSINMLGIPGKAGEEIRLYRNDLQGGGAFLTSTFSAQANAWVPDLTLNVGEAFWISKEQSEDWVRNFWVN